MSRNLTCLYCILVMLGYTVLLADRVKGDDKNQLQEIPQSTKMVEEVEPKTLPPVIDKIQLKQDEMRNTVVLVQTCRGRGSGTIVDCLETDVEGMFEYRVLTNAHIIRSRWITYLRGVNSLTRKIKIETVDTGCRIAIFNYSSNNWNQYIAEVIAEDNQYDLAILSLLSDEELAIVSIADDEMLKQVRVFDEVYAVGCQLGGRPIPTEGLIADISKNNKFTIYYNSAAISPGSSGGGLYKEYNGHYYLIGISYSVAVAPNGQFVPHLARAISIIAVMDFLNLNSVSYP